MTANHHSHELIVTQAELLAKKQGRNIPADALEFGRVMALAGFKTAEIDRGTALGAPPCAKALRRCSGGLIPPETPPLPPQHPLPLRLFVI